MYIKALEIQGFKSFPDKTVLNFGADITAIVGPNGSGKSNISDAIRWVMGEQSSRSLRGGKMEDVIFGGTEKRSQMGFAQVTLVLDNTQRVFPMDENEVAVTRRYYRSGESEYYINKQSVRLRDVNELFMDTGMGREGYSIIGQGKIDEILSVKSGDRREVFEEAAGISRYRHRKEETERKLERTEENLTRINDKIAELELQVEPLRQQSEVAKRYLILRDELRVMEISVWLTELENMKQAARKLESDYTAAVAELEQTNARMTALYTAAEQFSQQTMDNELAAEGVRAEATELEAQIAQRESEEAVLRTEIRHNEQSILRLEEELQEQSTRTGTMDEQIAAQQQRIAAIDEACREREAHLQQLLDRARQAAEHADAAASETEALRGKQTLALSEAADAAADISALQAAVQQMQERQQTLSTDREGQQQQQEQTRQAEKACRRALEDAQDEVAAVDNVLQGHALRMQSRERRRTQTQERAVQLTMEQNAMDSRIHLLEEMEREYEGFGQAVRLVMQAAEHRTVRGVHGPVASLITVEKPHAVAIETALGGGMQNLVVDREEDAKAAIGFLKQRNGGRATFLPLSAIRGDLLREPSVQQEIGFVGIASELVSAQPQYTNIMQNLLGRTVVVEDLDCGIAMARKYQSRFRIVTLDGQVLNRGGSMTGGSASKTAGILSRANELAQLRIGQEKGRQQLAAARREAEEALRELSATQYETETAQGQKRQAEDAVLKLQGEKNHYDILLAGLAESLLAMEREAELLTARLADMAAQIVQAESRRTDSLAEAAACRTALSETLTGQTELLSHSNAISEEIAGDKESLAGLRAEKESLLRSLDDLEHMRQNLLGDRQSRQTLIDGYRQSSDRAEEGIAALEQVAAGLRGQVQEKRDELARLHDRRQAIEAQRTLNDRHSRELNDTQLTMQSSVAKLEQKRATGALEEKQILDKLWERYELGPTAAIEQRIELESMAKANRRIGELNREIKGLGTPNIGAIEEFERVNTRYTYLTEQRDDVSQAKGELQGIIGKLTEEMTAIFARQFSLLNESFQETFLELFGGGKAQLELDDPSDILNCGIEIKVQPPGKTLKTITLLSGGEKAFVAIALYFSILKVHPTPFCVMDEIEAALDETNVVRYAKYMRRIAGKTQFIAITHRRGTMEEADVLYGVTMQERGVSKMLTIDMNDMAKQLKID